MTLNTTTYIDGAHLYNNPSEEAYRSVKQLHSQDDRPVKVLVSIGAGISKDLEADHTPNAARKGYFSFSKLVEVVTVRVTSSSEPTHQNLLDATRNQAECFRLNVERGLGGIKFDEWKGKKGDKTLRMIRTKTEDYLKSPNGRAPIAASAMRLVKNRRDRSDWQPDLDRWERFCYGVKYACPVRDCGNVGVYRTRQDLRSHVQRSHRIEPDRLEAVLDEGKRFPLDRQH